MPGALALCRGDLYRPQPADRRHIAGIGRRLEPLRLKVIDRSACLEIAAFEAVMGGSKLKTRSVLGIREHDRALVKPDSRRRDFLVAVEERALQVRAAPRDRIPEW